MDFSGTDEAVSLESIDFDITGLTTPWLEFFFYTNNTNDTSINDLVVEAWTGNSWDAVDTISQNLGGWVKFGYDLQNFTHNTDFVRVRFRAESGGSGTDYFQDFLLDDVTVMEAPSCFEPINLAVLPVGYSATVSWIAQGSATQWEIEYDTAGFTLGTGNVMLTSNNPETITGLDTLTNYDVYIRAVCGPNDSSLWVGPLSFMTTPQCPQPTTLTANVSGNMVTIGWTEIGSAAQWEYEYDVAGFVPGTGNTALTTADSAVLTVNYSTAYQYYVRSICGAGDTSLWSGPFGFTTPCAVNIPYYSESFNTFVPNCWDEANDGNQTTGPLQIGNGSWRGMTTLGGNTVAINLWTLGKSDWVLSPFFDLSAGGYELSLDMAVASFNGSGLSDMGSDDTVKVLYSEDGIIWDSLAVFTVDDSVSNILSSYVFPIPSTGSNVQFGIWGTEGTVNDPEDYDFHIDNFIVRIPPTCPIPSMLTVSNVTGSSAVVAWQENGSATQWQIEYDTLGFTMGTGNQVLTSSNPETISGLNHSTGYEVYVRAICGPNDTSVWLGPITFNTDFNAPGNLTCTTGGPGLIFSDDMETNSGWTGDIGTANGDWDFPTASPGGNSSGTGPSGPASGTTFAEFEASGGGSYVGTMVSPMIDLSGVIASAELSFYMHAFGDDMGTLEVGVGTSATGPFTNIFTHIGDYQTAANDPWAHIGLDLSAYVGQQIYLAFTNTHTGASWEGDRAIDLVEVRGCVSCPAPDSLAIANLTSTSVDLSWFEVGTATNWEIEYDDSLGFVLGSGTGVRVPTTTNPHSLSGLTSATNYEFYVRSVCGAGDSSVWVGPFQFTTPFLTPGNITCTTGGPGIIFSDDMEANTGWTGDISTSAGDWDFPTAAPGGNSGGTGPSGPASGTTFAEFEASGAGNATATMVTPMIDLGAVSQSAELSFYMHAFGDDMGTLEIGVGTSATGPFTNVFTHIGDYQTAANDPWEHIGVDISTYVGQQIYIAFTNTHASTGFEGDRAIDLVEVKGCVSCPAPDSLDVTNLTASSADLGWNENGTATTWEIEYDDSVGFVLGSGTGTRLSTTTNPHSLTLAANTSYEYYVRSICGPTDSSSWAGPFSFTTPCAVISTFPFLESFDVTSPTIGCWRNEYVVGNGDWGLYSGANGGTITQPAVGGYNLGFVSQSGNNSPVSNAISPVFDLTSLVGPRIKFFYAQEQWAGDQNYLRVLYRAVDTDPWTEIWSDSSEVDVWTEVIVNLPNSSATYQVAFQGINNFGRRNVVDEFIVEETPANDLMVLEVNTVGDECGLGQDSIRALIVNNGSVAQTGFPIAYTFNGVAISPETVTGTIAPFDSLWYTFSTLANFSTPGSIDLEAYTMLSGDIDLSNDTVSDQLSKTYLISTFPYLETFAAGQEGWSIDNGQNGTWDFGTPNKSIIVGAASDTNCFVTSLSGSYNGNEISFVNSPCFDFTALDDPYVQMSVWWESDFNWDGANLQYSTDDGDNWTVLGEMGDGENWYTSAGLIFGTGPAWTGTGATGSAGWRTATVGAMDLAGAPSVKFRVQFSSFFTGGDGFAFDDFAVFNGATLGNDTVLCTNDTLTLNPGDYSGYLWSDSSISSVYYLDAAVLNEGIDTIDVIVSGSGGFKMYDTVVVTVEKPTVNLGNDTVLCFGESITLDADTGFASYLWSDGTTMQTLDTDGSTSGATDYSVLVLTANDCPATDTINVSVNTEVLVDLGVDTAFTDSNTQGTSYLLDAGPGFASYLWSTGATSQTLLTDSGTDGQIWVVVTNSSGCEGTDTVFIDFKLSINGGLTVSTISMYPNPTSDVINISVSNFTALGEVNVKILDITGKVVMSERLQGNSNTLNETYDVSKLATGTYFVQFESNGEVVTRQFVIK